MKNYVLLLFISLTLNIFNSFSADSYLDYIPSTEEFNEKAYLVRVQNSVAMRNDESYDMTHIIPVGSSRKCLYWTLNGIIPFDTHEGMNYTDLTIISPLSKHINNTISISFPEVITMGPVELGEKDIIIFHRKNIYDLFASLFKSKNIKTFLFEEDVDTLTSLEHRRKYVRSIIKEELQGWDVDVKVGDWLWTPTTPVKVNGKNVHTYLFFQNLMKSFPQLTFGTDTYSYDGLCLLIHTCQINSMEQSLYYSNPYYPDNLYPYIEFFRFYRDFMSCEMKDFFSRFKNFSKEVNKSVSDLLGIENGPCKNFEKNDYCSPLSEPKTILKDYNTPEFIQEFIMMTYRFPESLFNKFKSSWPGWNIFSQENRNFIENLFKFTKWAEKKSPRLYHFIDQDDSEDLPFDCEQLKKTNEFIKGKISAFIFQKNALNPKFDEDDVDDEKSLYAKHQLLSIELFDNPEKMLNKEFHERILNS